MASFRLIAVDIPTDTFSKHLTVPEYEVPVLLSLWQPHVPAGKQIDTMWLGAMTEGPSPTALPAVDAEYKSLQRTYRYPEGGIVVDAVFAGLAGFRAELERLRQRGPGPMDRLVASDGRAGAQKPGEAGGIVPPLSGAVAEAEGEGEEDFSEDLSAAGEDELPPVVAAAAQPAAHSNGLGSLEGLKPYLPAPMRDKMVTAMEAAGIMSVDDLTMLPDESLLELPYISEKTLPKIKAGVAKLRALQAAQ
jgi:hypothetical protein